MTSWKETIGPAAQKIIDAREAKKIKLEQVRLDEESTVTKKRNDRIKELLVTWNTEVKPNLEILDKCGIQELFEEINTVSFGGKGKVSNNSPKDRDDYDDGCFSYGYKPCEITLNADYIGYEEETRDCVHGKGEPSPEGLRINKIEISIKIINSKRDKKIELRFDGNYCFLKTIELDYPKFPDQDKIDQFKEELVNTLVHTLTRDSSFPFTELSEDALRVLEEKGDADYIKKIPLNGCNLPELSNGDKILHWGMKKGVQIARPIQTARPYRKSYGLL